METSVPYQFERLDGVSLAQRLLAAECLLFERFDLITRQRAHTIVGVRWKHVAGVTFEQALRTALAGAATPDTAHLVFCGGDETLRADQNDGFPPFIVLRLDEYVRIDHARRHATHVCDGVAATLSPAALATLLEHAAHEATVASGARAGGDGWTPDVDRDGHALRVGAIQSKIAAGHLDGAVLSVRLSKTTDAAPLDIYREMIRINPSTFGYCIVSGNQALVGSSPLAFLDFHGGSVRLETDAGTRPVTGDARVDADARAELLASEKDAREHAVVVEEETRTLHALADADGVGREVDREVRAFSHVMHLYTVLRARLRRGAGLAEAVLGLFPPAAVSGKPRRAARQAGTEQETGPRGPYGGVLGLVRGREEAELAVVIRSLWVDSGVASTRVGGKIVADSIPADEYDEALNKARFIVQSVAGAERLRGGSQHG